jgi:hypothetical protein
LFFVFVVDPSGDASVIGRGRLPPAACEVLDLLGPGERHRMVARMVLAMGMLMMMFMFMLMMMFMMLMFMLLLLLVV